MTIPTPRDLDDIAAEWAETCEAFRHAAGHSGMRAVALAQADGLLDLWLEMHRAPGTPSLH